MKIIIVIFLFFVYEQGIAQTKKFTLKECMDVALENNISLNKSKLGNKIGEINKREASQSRLPTLYGGIGHNYQFGRSVDPSTNQFIQQNYRTNNVALNSDLVVFSGWQQVNKVKQADLEDQAGKLLTEKEQNDLKLAVTLAYYDVLGKYEQKESAAFILESSKAQLERTEQLVKAGRLPELNELQMSTQVSMDKSSLIEADNLLALSKLQLQQLMEKPFDENFDVQRYELTDPAALSNIYSTSDIYNSSVSVLPVTQISSIKKEQAFLGLKVAQGLQLPKVTLSASLFTFYSGSDVKYNFTGEIQKNSIGYLKSNPKQEVIVEAPVMDKMDYGFGQQLRDKVGEQIGINIHIPIVQGRQIRSGIEREKIRCKLAEYEHEETKNLLKKEIEKGVREVKSAYALWQSSGESAAAAEKSYINAGKRLTIGMINYTEYIQQKNIYHSSKALMLQSKYHYYAKMKVLEYYLGKL